MSSNDRDKRPASGTSSSSHLLVPEKSTFAIVRNRPERSPERLTPDFKRKVLTSYFSPAMLWDLHLRTLISDVLDYCYRATQDPELFWDLTGEAFDTEVKGLTAVYLANRQQPNSLPILIPNETGITTTAEDIIAMMLKFAQVAVEAPLEMGKRWDYIMGAMGFPLRAGGNNMAWSMGQGCNSDHSPAFANTEVLRNPSTASSRPTASTGNETTEPPTGSSTLQQASFTSRGSGWVYTAARHGDDGSGPGH